jgi:hypothetical protein
LETPLRLSLFAALSILASAASLDAATAAELLRGRCHMDVCSWFSIEQRDLVASSPAGALFKMSVRTWTSTHPNGTYDKRTRRVGGEAGDEYVFCSKSRPAVVDPGDKPGTWIAAVLVPIGQPAGAAEAATARYFAACHGVALNSEADLDRYAQAFGYKADGEGEQLDLKRPEDILKPAEPVRR